MTSRVITSIGGAGIFTYSLSARLAHHRKELGAALSGCSLRVKLLDIDTDRLAAAVRFARRAFAEAGWGDELCVEGTTCEAEALDGAGMVILARPFYDAEEACVEAARRHGLTDINAGPASIGVARLAFPEIRRLATSIRQRGEPDAVLLNLVNPTDVLAHATQAATGVTTWGMCGAPDGTRKFLAEMLGVETHRITRLRTVGVNHFSYLVELEVDGTPAMPLLRETCEARLRNDSEVSPRLKAWLDHVVTTGRAYLTVGHPQPWCQPCEPVYVWKNPETSALRAAVERQMAADRIDTGALIRTFGWLDDTGHALMRMAAALWGNATYEEGWQSLHQGEIPSLPQGGWIERTMKLAHGRLATADFAPLPEAVQAQVALLALQRREMGIAILEGSADRAVQALAINPFNAPLPAARGYIHETWGLAADAAADLKSRPG